ncbi:predicted protein [Histoplasma capsulatum var. duboisii H88]|uniref:Predicted protein n=1 Tax=Ajellomyces capsulatus (strain H88) TaxID=544711 RepID=F0UKU7_AJEC8|nr:predicted protein [Histoplasma capsulatum var. duboisii H88]
MKTIKNRLATPPDGKVITAQTRGSHHKLEIHTSAGFPQLKSKDSKNSNLKTPFYPYMLTRTQLSPESVNGAHTEAGGNGGNGTGAGKADNPATGCQNGQGSSRVVDTLRGKLLEWVLTAI